MGSEQGKEQPTYYCSFCGKSQHAVWKLIASDRAFICNECVDLCVEVCDKARAEAITKGIIAKALKMKRSAERVLSARFWGGVDG